MVKKNIAALMLLLLIASANAQSVNKNFEVVNLASQSNGKINAQMFIEKHSGLQGQQFGIVITNLTQHKLKITGTYAAKLTCGNQTTNADINITLKPGETQGGKQYLMETSGLSATVFSESCKGNPVYENGTQVGYNRIKSVTYDITKITDLTEQEQQSSYQSDRQNNNDNTNIGSNNQSLYATNNAGYYKTDNTNTSNNSNNKKTSSLYNGTVTKTTTATRTTNNAGNTYAQQFQQWQNNNAQTQQNISNTISQLGDIAQNYLQQRQQQRDEEYARQEQARKEKEAQDEQERQEKQARQEQEQAREEQEQIRLNQEREEKREEKNRQFNMDQQIIGANGINQRKETSELGNDIKKAYYIIFSRDYTNNEINIKTYLLHKYSDDTWMLESDFKKKISFVGFYNDYGSQWFLGAYNKTTADEVLNHIKSNATGTLKIDNSFTPVNDAPQYRVKLQTNSVIPSSKTIHLSRTKRIKIPDGVICDFISFGNSDQHPIQTDEVEMKYTIKLENGTLVDNNHNEPLEVPINNMITGFQEALILMRPGDKCKVFIPALQAYGSKQVDKIPANSNLICTIELVNIITNKKGNTDNNFWNN